MTPSTPSPKARVLAKWPDARCWEHYPGDWQIAIGQEQPNGSKLITYANSSEDEAWESAASRLSPAAVPEPQVDCLACTDCGRPYPHGCDFFLTWKQWAMIYPEIHGVLCPNCMVDRASKIANTATVYGFISTHNDEDPVDAQLVNLRLENADYCAETRELRHELELLRAKPQPAQPKRPDLERVESCEHGVRVDSLCEACEDATTCRTVPEHGDMVSSCPYCGPTCYKGAAHNARKEDGVVYELAASPEPTHPNLSPRTYVFAGQEDNRPFVLAEDFNKLVEYVKNLEVEG